MARLFELLIMKNSRAIGYFPGQQHNINMRIMISHLFFPEAVNTSPLCVMWLYGLFHIWQS